MSESNPTVVIVRGDEAGALVAKITTAAREGACGSSHLEVISGNEILTEEEMINRYTARVLGMLGGNKTHAAKALGIDRRSLYRRLERIAKKAA